MESANVARRARTLGAEQVAPHLAWIWALVACRVASIFHPPPTLASGAAPQPQLLRPNLRNTAYAWRSNVFGTWFATRDAGSFLSTRFKSIAGVSGDLGRV